MANFDIELSFTILDWKIAETVVNDRMFSIEDVEEEQRVELCFNLFPQGNSLLHLLSM